MRNLERLKCYLWYGNIGKAWWVIQCIEMDVNVAMVNDGHTHVNNFKSFIPNPTTQGIRD